MRFSVDCFYCRDFLFLRINLFFIFFLFLRINLLFIFFLFSFLHFYCSIQFFSCIFINSILIFYLCFYFASFPPPPLLLLLWLVSHDSLLIYLTFSFQSPSFSFLLLSSFLLQKKGQVVKNFVRFSRRKQTIFSMLTKRQQSLRYIQTLYTFIEQSKTNNKPCFSWNP